MSPQDFLGRVFCQDSKDLHQIPDESIDAVISSFAWEDQADYGDDPENLGRYRGDDFVERAVRHVEALKPKVKRTGNILIELQSAIHDGAASLVEEKFAIAAVERCGLHLVQKLYSIRSNAEPLAPPNRLRRGVVPIFHFVRDPQRYVVFKDHVRQASVWAARDRRPHKYHPDGKDPGDLIWSRQQLLSGHGPDYVALNAAGMGQNFVASPKAQSAKDLGHPAVMADAVAEFLVLFGTDVGGVVMDVMAGTGTTLLAAKKHGRRVVGYEINPKFAALARQRLGIDVDEEAAMMSKTWMNAKEVAAYTGLALATVYSKTSRGEIPVHRGSGLPRYHREEIDAFMRGKPVQESIQTVQNSAKGS